MNPRSSSTLARRLAQMGHVVVCALALYGGTDIARHVSAQPPPVPHGYLPVAARAAQVGGAPQDDLEERVRQLEELLAPLSRQGDDVYFTGVDLHVVNGASRTDAPPNGKGNIIIGYNEMRGGTDIEGNPVDQRTGSHYLIVGRGNSYSGFGGIVIGSSNSSAGEYASTIGGQGNVAGGDFAVVIGGSANQATGPGSIALGGDRNQANGLKCLAIAGELNTCFGDTSAVLGGDNNRTGTDARSATVTGGRNNTVLVESGSVSGGAGVELGGGIAGAWAAGNLRWP